MAHVTLRGNPYTTNGDLPPVGSRTPDFSLVGTDLSDITPATLAGTKVVLNIFPSIDTPTCANSVRAFNERAASLDNTTVLNVSADLPFAMSRFCGAEGVEDVEVGSTFRHGDTLDAYGVRQVDGPLAGLAARAVFVIDENGTVIHSQLVSELGEEPDYDAVLGALGS
jgi:thiol peroxidase